VSRYRCISARKTEGHNARLACRALHASPSSYYEWRARHERGPSPRDLDEAHLVNEIMAIHHLDDSYGSPRLTNELAKRGFCANHKRVERLVSDYGLYATDARRKRVKTTIRDLWAPPLPDRVQRNFRVGAPGRRTCGDLTYIATAFIRSGSCAPSSHWLQDRWVAPAETTPWPSRSSPPSTPSSTTGAYGPRTNALASKSKSGSRTPTTVDAATRHSDRSRPLLLRCNT
jgi:hypothetical protein